MTQFIVKRGIVPPPPESSDGMYNELRQALIDAAVNEWLYIEVPTEAAERVRASLNARNCPQGAAIRASGFKVQTRARNRKHDETIPEGICRMFFRKVR